MMRRQVAVRAAIATGVAALLALAPAMAAQAADEVRVSTDGVTWGSTLSAPLFSTVAGFVPEESRSATLWVQNSSSHEVALRITLDSATWSDEALADAMTIGASAPGAAGTTMPATADGDCRVLLSAVTLDPGESIAVTMTLALGSLTGLIGQDATVSMGLGVTIVETAGSASSAGCAPPVVTVPVTPPAASRPGGAGADPEVGEPTATPTPTSTPTEEPEAPQFIFASMIGFDNGSILWALAAVLVGGAIYYVREYLPWRRARSHDEAVASGNSNEGDVS